MTPAVRQRLTLAVLALLLVVLAIVLLTSDRSGPRNSPTSTPATSAPPLVLNPGHPPTSPSLTQPVTQAQTAAHAFLTSYLPVLYGRHAAKSIIDADAHVHQSLRAEGHPTRAPASLHPHVIALVGEPQSSRSVLELATIADGVSAPYRIVFVIAQRRGAWQVTQLANY